MAGERVPDFFLVGGPKCGTTAFASYLGAHPAIFLPAAKDSHYFGSDLSVIHRINHPPDLFRVREETYRGWFAGREEKRLGEASVLYLLSEKAAAEIKAFSPEARIIIMLRDPLAMISSLHNHCLYTGNEELADIAAALAAEPERIAGRRLPATAFLPDALHYRRCARYAGQVRRYFDVFGRERVLVLLFDDLRADAAGAYRRALEFLGVDPEFRPDFAVVNQARRQRWPGLKRFVLNPPRWLRPLAYALSRTRGVRAAVQKFLAAANTVTEKPPPLPAALAGELRAEFAPELERLERLIGRDLSDWKG